MFLCDQFVLNIVIENWYFKNMGMCLFYPWFLFDYAFEHSADKTHGKWKVIEIQQAWNLYKGTYHSPML